jgi:uncharacterized protein (UPF0261 family)
MLIVAVSIVSLLDIVMLYFLKDLAQVYIIYRNIVHAVVALIVGIVLFNFLRLQQLFG